MNCSLIVIHFGDVNLTKSLLNTLRDHPDRLLFSEVIIIDNGGRLEEDEIESLRMDDIVSKVVLNTKESYSSGVNKGVEVSRGEFLVISNNDIEWIEGDSIGPALATLTRKTVGIVGPQQVHPDGSWQRSFGRLPSVSNELRSIAFLDTFSMLVSKIKYIFNMNSVTPRGYIDGAFLLVDGECFYQLNGFDEEFTFYAEEADFCFRARQQGWLPICNTLSRIIHIGGASSSEKNEVKYASRLVDAKCRFVKKHYGESHERIFNFLQNVSTLERLLIYSFVGFLFGGDWRERAATAKNRVRSITIKQEK